MALRKHLRFVLHVSIARLLLYGIVLSALPWKAMVGISLPFPTQACLSTTFPNLFPSHILRKENPLPGGGASRLPLILSSDQRDTIQTLVQCMNIAGSNL
jgi:hypothetical protein